VITPALPKLAAVYHYREGGRREQQSGDRAYAGVGARREDGRASGWMAYPLLARLARVKYAGLIRVAV
jgi:hypothetical protein